MKIEKIIIINSCDQCPYYNHDDSYYMHKWGKHWCEKLDKEFKNHGNIIPEDCPLPDKNDYEKNN